jgi:hypothetical protein
MLMIKRGTKVETKGSLRVYSAWLSRYQKSAQKPVHAIRTREAQRQGRVQRMKQVKGI